MGQAMRMARYDRAANEANSIQALNFLNQNLSWHRLDDGVMGGMSETIHASSQGTLNFRGTINTQGGGFTSIRAPLPSGISEEVEAIRIRYRGDGKTYKVLLSDGNKSTGGPFSRSPTWQADLPTEKRQGTESECEEKTIPLDSFLPTFGPRTPSPEETKQLKLDPKDINLIGFMLSLKLSDGSSNPPETFGTGIFDFALDVESISAVLKNQN